MIKTVLRLSLLGLVILAACSRPAMREQENASLPLSNSPPIDLNAALARAKAEHKLVFLDFTGSDWCPPCMDLQKKVFSQPEFRAYAESNLVFLSVDFPLKFKLTPEAKATNNLLAQQFRVDAPPTLIALNADGKEIWKRLGPVASLGELSNELAVANSNAK